MRQRGALLLILSLAVIVSSTTSTFITTEQSTERVDLKQGKENEKIGNLKTISNATAREARRNIERSFLTKKLDYENFLNPKETLLQEIRSLDEDAPTEKFQEAVAKAIKAEAQKTKLISKVSSLLRENATIGIKTINNSADTNKLKNFLETEDMVYNDDEDEENEDEDDDYDDDDDDDDDDDGDDDDDDDVDVDDGDNDDNDADGDVTEEDDMMVQCPDYCKCVRQFGDATTAKCSRLDENQSFGPGIAHLKIEDADPIHLGPLAFRARGLQQLESIAFVNTPILELDKTAFNGIPYLFAVNLTRNGLKDIPVDLFRNNSQLNLLSISGNPMKHSSIAFKAKAREYLLNSSSITELDLSDNFIPRLPHTAFNKMPNLVYINLKNNKLKNVDRAHFNKLVSLVELDLSNNELQEIPIDLFLDKGIQTLKITGNNLTTLSTIVAEKLTTLNASNNKIKLIHKDDLIRLPALDQLTLRSNGLKRIHQHSFSQHDQLIYLDISDNKLTMWTEHHLRANSRLQVLLMSDNPELNTLPVFKPNQEYDAYSIYRFECANCGLDFLSEGTFDSMPALTSLNLARNYLTRLPKNLFNSLSALIELDLSDNRIKIIDNNMFHGALSLTKLNIAGNFLISLQVTPFLETPNLSNLDVSRCGLERIWSEARVPLKNLRFLSVRQNLLQRITLEELRATPKISGFDLIQNPFKCDQDLNATFRWLIEHGVSSMESVKSVSDYSIADGYSEFEGNTEWTDLVKTICDRFDDGPPPRPVPHKPVVYNVLKNDLATETQFDHGQNHENEFGNAWSTEEQEEYEDYAPEAAVTYHPFYRRALWLVLIMTVFTVTFLLTVIHFTLCLVKRRGRGPVIRPPMILRQGLVDNKKNCGLVYKPLQEEIATPHMPKRGTFYSSSTFHYDKIVPESV